MDGCGRFLRLVSGGAKEKGMKCWRGRRSHPAEMRKGPFYKAFAGSVPAGSRGLSPQRRGLSPSFFALPTIVDKLQDDAKKIGGDNSYQINIGV